MKHEWNKHESDVHTASAGAERAWSISLGLALAPGLLVANSALAAQPSLSEIFRSSLTCALIEPLLADMKVTPLYQQEQGGCTSVVPDERDQDYFSDASCETPLAFEPTTLISHCELLLNADLLGEGEGIDAPIWTLPPGARLDVGARSLEGVQQPYLQRQIYRTVQTEQGECSLEMRVYAANPVSDGEQQPSLLALHGGSWSSRGFGFFGLEMSIPHFVDAGFVVYAPFYRLLGDSEGSDACNQASIEQISDDASAALSWVQNHAAEYDSSPKPVVFGQSAGAHLATSLAVNAPDEVAAAVLFYTPTDFTDFALRAQQGYYDDEQGLGILERLLNVELDAVDISAAPIPENSFPQRIVEQGIEMPPVFMVHGMQDELVEARQSVRLCDAMAGSELLALDVEVAVPDTLREIVQCGADSQLQLIREGDHALDVCLAGALLPTDLCPSGSEASRQEVASAIGEAVSFASSIVGSDDETGGSLNPAEEAGSESGGESGGGAGLALSGLLGLGLLLRRRRWLVAMSCRSA